MNLEQQVCPKCKSRLVAGKPRQYETLAEHVSDLNAFMYIEPPLRPTLVCPNRCYGSSYWNEDGDAYSVVGPVRRFLWRITDYRWPGSPKCAPDLPLG